MRGLKHMGYRSPYLQRYVASFTDAWIETVMTLSYHIYLFVASFTDAWIETVTERGEENTDRRILYGCVD